MTLRVRISVVPYGDESDEYEIEQLNISNVGTTDFREWEYVVEHNEYKQYDDSTPRVFHERPHGPLVLVKKALERLLRDI
jgi:hypothetical protein